ncbi:hypothetical protein Tco_0033411 [Tanacetum coccineum]
MVTIGGRLSKGCKEQLKTLLKGNMEVFAWEPADMTGVPRRVIEHALNVNLSLDPVCQKRRTFSSKKSRAVTKEVTELIKAGIVRPVKYPTYITTQSLVKKVSSNPNGERGRRKNSFLHGAGNVLLYEDVVRSKERRGHLSKTGRLDLPEPDRKKPGGIRMIMR